MHLALYSVCTASAKRCLDGDLQRGGVARSRARAKTGRPGRAPCPPRYKMLGNRVCISGPPSWYVSKTWFVCV